MINGMVSWVTDAVSWFVGALLRFFEHSSTPNLAASWFSGNGSQSPYGVVAALALSLLLLFVLIAVIQGALSGDGVAMAARLARDIPLAILGITATIGVTQVLLGATDELSHVVLDGTAAGAQAKTVLQHLGSVGAFSGQATFVVFILGLFAVVGAFLLWIELLIRASLLYVLLACSPLAFACFVWPAARRVLHRLAELILALVLSKVVIAIALAVAASALTQGTTNPAVIPTGEAQVGTLLVGVIMFLLAALAPFIVLKLFPVVEAAVVAQGISPRSGAHHPVRGHHDQLGGPSRRYRNRRPRRRWRRWRGRGQSTGAGRRASSPPAGSDGRAADTRAKGPTRNRNRRGAAAISPTPPTRRPVPRRARVWARTWRAAIRRRPCRPATCRERSRRAPALPLRAPRPGRLDPGAQRHPMRRSHRRAHRRRARPASHRVRPPGHPPGARRVGFGVSSLGVKADPRVDRTADQLGVASRPAAWTAGARMSSTSPTPTHPSCPRSWTGCASWKSLCAPAEPVPRASASLLIPPGRSSARRFGPGAASSRSSSPPSKPAFWTPGRRAGHVLSRTWPRRPHHLVRMGRPRLPRAASRVRA